ATVTPAERGDDDRVVVTADRRGEILARQPLGDGIAESSLLPNGRRNGAQPEQRLLEGNRRVQTATAKSRSASLRLTFRSVLSLRVPMMSAQGTANSPAGNFFGRIPGMTTERAGTRPRCSTGFGPETSTTTVEEVRMTPAPITASLPT